MGTLSFGLRFSNMLIDVVHDRIQFHWQLHIEHLRVQQVVVELFEYLLVSSFILFNFGSNEFFPCDIRADEDLQRRHLADGAQLGLVPGFVLIHVCLPYRELQPAPALVLDGEGFMIR